jgi:uncharacterized protein YsxB (DUF464 family)
MIQVTLTRKKDGFTCRAEGHAGFAEPGKDIVCAAATILLRTTAETLAKTPGLRVTPLDVAPGLLAFEVHPQDVSSTGDSPEAKPGGKKGALTPPGGTEMALGAALAPPGGTEETLRVGSEFIRTGMGSLEREFPGRVLFREDIQ